MPNEGMSLYFSISASGAINTMTTLGDKTKALDKETQSLAQAQEGLKRANEPLLKKQAELRTALDKLKSETKDAKKAWEQYGDELHEGIYTNLLEEQAELQEQLRNVNDQVKANQKTFREYQEDIRKGGISESGGGALGDESSGSILTAIVGGQIGQMLSSSLGGAAQTLLTSAIGTPTANLASDAISSAIQGAALGTAIAPGIGTAIGAGAGALSGIVSGGTQIYQQRDEAFKDYYNGLYEDALSQWGDAIASGKGFASTRETDLRALSTLLSDRDEAKAFQKSLIEMGRTPPFSYDTVTSLSKNMLGLGLGVDAITERVNGLANAAAALDLSESNVSSIISYLESAELADKLDTRVLRSLSKMGINAYEALADEFVMSESDVAANLGNLDVERGINAIYRYMDEHFANAADSLTSTYSGALGVLDSYKEDLDAAAGASYNTLRTIGVQEEIDAYGGALGDALKEVNSIAGEAQAYRENLAEQYKREAQEAVYLGNQTTLFDDEQREELHSLHDQYVEAMRVYDEAKETYGAASDETHAAALEVERLKDRTDILAQAAIDASGVMDTLHDSQKRLVEETRNLAAKFGEWEWKYALGVEQTKGQAATLGLEDSAFGGLGASSLSSAEKRLDARDNINTAPRKRSAFGLNRVPYDDYAALLHEGERVLTAQEARAQDQGGRDRPVQPITIKGNNFYGTPEEMVMQMFELMCDKLDQGVVAYGR